MGSLWKGISLTPVPPFLSLDVTHKIQGRPKDNRSSGKSGDPFKKMNMPQGRLDLLFARPQGLQFHCIEGSHLLELPDAKQWNWKPIQ